MKARHCLGDETNLPCKEYAGKHDVLRVLVQDTEAEVCSLEKCERCRSDFVWKMQCLAYPLNCAGIVAQQLLLFL